MASWLAVVPPIVTGVEVAPVSPAALNPRVRLPAVRAFPTRRSVAPPEALVVAVVVPPRVPPPLAIAAVTVTPLWETGLPPGSRDRSIGGWANGLLPAAELDG